MWWVCGNVLGVRLAKLLEALEDGVDDNNNGRRADLDEGGVCDEDDLVVEQAVARSAGPVGEAVGEALNQAVDVAGIGVHFEVESRSKMSVARGMVRRCAVGVIGMRRGPWRRQQVTGRVA